MTKPTERKTLIANLNKVWSDAKLGKTSQADLEWLTEIAQVLAGDKDEKSLSETMSKYRKGYTKAKAYNGMATVNNGDDLASLLLPLDPQETVALAERVLDLAEDELWDRYAHLNNGQRRMNAGNKLRFALKKETITLANVKKAIA